MKRFDKTTILKVLVLTGAVIFAGLLTAQGTTGTATTTTTAKGPNDQSLLKDFFLSDFENAEDWRAFATSPLGETKVRKTIQLGPIRDVFNPDQITDDEKKDFEENKNHVLGIKTNFVDRGFDRVEIMPPHEYTVKGVARQISVWALGRNYRHTLYVKIRDFSGKLHKLRFGRLDFLGWRKLILTIPGWVPQSPRYSLLDKNLKFVSIFVESDVHEVGGQFYFYVDNLSMKVDKTDVVYPGSQIKDTW